MVLHLLLIITLLEILVNRWHAHAERGCGVQYIGEDIHTVCCHGGLLYTPPRITEKFKRTETRAAQSGVSRCVEKMGYTRRE